jgi:hypothetical protein
VTRTLRPVDPATGDEVASYPAFTASEVDAALAAAHEAERAWRGTSLDERARLLAGRPGCCANGGRSAPPSSLGKWASRSPRHEPRSTSVP